jgi:hypothetical protein
MARTTQKELAAQFKRFVKNIGGRVAANDSDVGGFKLEHSTPYGYRVVRVSGVGLTAEPWGLSAYSLREMYMALNFASMTLEAKRDGHLD